jgi:hypothetical protein
MLFELRARLRHWLFGKHTPVQGLRDDARWCWVCGDPTP